MSSIRMSRLKRLTGEQSGVTAVEFGLIAPALIMMIMGIVELGLMMAGQTILDNAAFAASRIGKTGATTATNTQQQLILAAVQRAASDYLDPAKITLSSLAYSDYSNIGQPEPFTDLNSNGVRDANEPYTDVNGNGSYDKDQGAAGYGGAGQIVVYVMRYDWPLKTPLISKLVGKNGVVPLTSRIVVKNEPYG